MLDHGPPRARPAPWDVPTASAGRPERVPGTYAGTVPRLLAPVALAVLALLSLAAPASAADREPPLVVLGTAGLRWEDLDPAATPTLWALATEGASASLVTRSVRTASCAADGWLALGAGNRAADTLATGCRELEEPVDGTVRHWEEYRAARDAQSYGSRLGLLGDLVREHGLDSLAVGPGAAIALADGEGRVVGEHLAQDSGPLSPEGRDLLVVDLGVVTDGPDRTAQVARLEERAGRVDVTGARTVLVSLADAARAPRLQVLGTRGLLEGEAGATLLTGSTRHEGYVLATDLLPTLLEALGVPAPEQLVGAPARTAPAQGDRVAAMVDLDRHATAIRALTPGFFTVLIVVNLALYAAAWWRTVRPGRVFRVLGVLVGALPVSTFLANLLPWWRVPGGLYLAVAGMLGLVTALALGGPWRRAPLGPLTTVATVTATTIVADVLTGSHLQLGSPMGVHPLVAGRFYGLNNSAFSLLMVSSLLVAAVAGHALARRRGRAWGVGLVVLLGLAVTVVDGMPGLGSDFGGPPALVPAFAVLALLVSGTRVGWRRLVLVLLAGVVVVTAFAVVDWQRPVESRTHLGRFVQTVLDGGLLDVVARKAGQNLTILTSSWLVLLVAAGVALVVRLARGRGGQAGTLQGAMTDLAPLRLALPAAAVGLAVGFAVNDSGVVIPAIGTSLGLPLLLAELGAWRLSGGADDAAGAAPRGPAPAGA